MDPVKREESAVELNNALWDTDYMNPHSDWFASENSKAHERLVFMWEVIERYYQSSEDWLIDVTVFFVYQEIIKKIDQTEWSDQYRSRAENLKAFVEKKMNSITEKAWREHPIHSGRRRQDPYGKIPK